MDVKTLCLGVLALRPATGYDIRKWFENGSFSHFQDAAFGSIYPALKALAADGLVTVTEEPGGSRPDRKLYTITESGRRAFRMALERPPAADRVRSDLTFILFFGHLLPPDRLDDLIDGRIAWLRQAIAHMDSCTDPPPVTGPRFVLGYGLAIYRAALAYLEQNRHLLTGTAAPAARATEQGPEPS